MAKDDPENGFRFQYSVILKNDWKEAAEQPNSLLVFRL